MEFVAPKTRLYLGLV